MFQSAHIFPIKYWFIDIIFFPLFSVLTYCHIHKIRAVLYVCYTDSIHLDFATLKTFQPLIQATPINVMHEV